MTPENQTTVIGAAFVAAVTTLTMAMLNEPLRDHILEGQIRHSLAMSGKTFTAEDWQKMQNPQPK